MILPSVNTVVEAWFPRMLPPRASLHVARMLLPDALTPGNVAEMDRSTGAAALAQLQCCRLDALVYGCFASSVVGGIRHDEALCADLGAAAGIPVATAAGCLIDACGVLGLEKVCVCSPYDDVIDAAERRYLQDRGLVILGHRHMGIRSASALAQPDGKAFAQAALECLDPKADGIILSCMNARSHLAIDYLEKTTGLPVVTSTQAALWKLLRMGGLTEAVAGAGRLLR